jgi:hypothetical protein
LATDHGDAQEAILEQSVISGSKSSYEFFRCQLGFRLGREVIWRHDAAHPLATDTLANPHVRDNGRAPSGAVPVFMLASRRYERTSVARYVLQRAIAPALRPAILRRRVLPWQFADVECGVAERDQWFSLRR